MARCSACGTRILFGGVKDGDLRFCNANCQRKGHLVRVARDIPKDLIVQRTAAIYHGSCPRCQGPGPVDMHTSYRVWSALILTSWESRPHVCCRSCGRKSQAGDAVFSLVLGWWGFPWGLLVTPVQVTRNIAGIFKSDGLHRPSADLEHATSMLMAAEGMNRPR